MLFVLPSVGRVFDKVRRVGNNAINAYPPRAISRNPSRQSILYMWLRSIIAAALRLLASKTLL